MAVTNKMLEQKLNISLATCLSTRERYLQTKFSQTPNTIFEGFYLLYSTRTSRPPSFFIKSMITEHAQAHFSARAEICPRLHEVFLNFSPVCEITGLGLKVSPCNRKRLFKKICSRGLDETSARLTGLKFVM